MTVAVRNVTRRLHILGGASRSALANQISDLAAFIVGPVLGLLPLGEGAVELEVSPKLFLGLSSKGPRAVLHSRELRARV